jgi:tetratricopeptide (TPR) repeat protein
VGGSDGELYLLHCPGGLGSQRVLGTPAPMPDSYQEGLRAMESGRYREAVAALESARVNRPNDPQVKLWLVMAYEANQQRELARDLCRELTSHPDPQIRQQSQRVLYILEAPQLRRRAEWLNQIPLMTDESPPGVTFRQRQSKPSPPAVASPPAEPRVEQNHFISLALVGFLLALLLWAGWG